MITDWDKVTYDGYSRSYDLCFIKGRTGSGRHHYFTVSSKEGKSCSIVISQEGMKIIKHLNLAFEDGKGKIDFGTKETKDGSSKVGDDKNGKMRRL